jgi:AAA15 family ATPase/GTPase
MLIRVVLENIFSFGEEVEFNMLPYKRLGTLPHHQYDFGDVSLLKMTGIYGANGAGKSNLIKTLHYLQLFVDRGKYPFNLKNAEFKFNRNLDKPQTIAVEFIEDGVPYVYAIQLKNNSILREELYKSGLGVGKDSLVYERFNENGKVNINFDSSFNNSAKGELLREILISDFLQSDSLSLKILSNRENDYFDDCKRAYRWLTKTLVIIHPSSKPTALAHQIDTSSEFKSYAEDMMCSFNIGISSLELEKKSIDEFFGEDNDKDKVEIIASLDENPNAIIGLKTQGKDEFVVVKENGNYWVKQLRIKHKAVNEEVLFDLEEESDGTIRLLDFVPAFRSLKVSRKVYLVDEIERSIHPLLIKKLVEKYSKDKFTMGQLVFTTHESNLLDQSIFRQDEIWFAEKDKLGNTHLYSLSKFKEHKTIDIQKGYLSGRYGAIPFLNDLENLNWSQYDTQEETV